VFEPATLALLDAGMTLHARAADKDWSLTDCISFHVMLQRNLTQAPAYDKHFVQAGFEALLRQEPPAA
jgi:predicted nucleic acid-binding protein